MSRLAIIHEVYHVLGFAYPGDPLGVRMSESLNRGLNHGTMADASDLAKLACIYD